MKVLKSGFFYLHEGKQVADLPRCSLYYSYARPLHEKFLFETQLDWISFILALNQETNAGYFS